MRTQHIRALTGVRFFAALWVVVYHSTRHNSELIRAHHPQALDLFGPLTGAGYRGVDLFFMLSGFVLALNYTDKLGGRLRLRPSLRFLWLRLARIWPLYMLVLVVGGALRLMRHELWNSAGAGALTWENFVRQTLMVQMWFPPEKGSISWVGPAWSLSAEWLAYVLFPVVVLAVARAQRNLRARGLLVLAGLAMMPLVVGVAVGGDLGGKSWILRILCEFVTGMLLCAAASRLRLTSRARRLAGTGAILTVVAVVAHPYIGRAVDVPGWWSGTIVLLFVPLVFFLGIGTGPLHDLLATRALVLGGAISYALYLVHSPMLYLYRDVTRFTSFHLDPLPRYYGELLLIPVMVLTAWLLYRFFEEPARMAMRRMLEIPFARAATSPVPPPEEDERLEEREHPRAPAQDETRA